MKRVVVILLLAMAAGCLLAIGGCANSPYPSDTYYPSGTIYSDAYPATYGRGYGYYGYGRYGRPYGYRY